MKRHIALWLTIAAMLAALCGCAVAETSAGLGNGWEPVCSIELS